MNTLGTILFPLSIIVIVLLWFIEDQYHDDNPHSARKFIFIPIVVGVMSLFLMLFVTIPQGNRGVVLTWGKVTGIMTEGLHARLPGIQSVVKMSIKTQLFSVEATAASKDLQDVAANIGLNYKLDPSRVGIIYGTIGLDYIEVIAHPLIQETVKEITAKYNAEDMILKRSNVKQDITDALITRLEDRGIIAEQVNITDFTFSEEFTKAIESKVVAIQKVLEAENKLRQIEVEARQAEQKAKGEASAVIALATGQAEANKILGESLTPTLIQYMFIQNIKNTDKIVTVPGNISLTLPSP